MECLLRCLPDCVDEWGDLSYSPLSKQELRERQDFNRETRSYMIRTREATIHLDYNFVCHKVISTHAVHMRPAVQWVLTVVVCRVRRGITPTTSTRRIRTRANSSPTLRIPITR